MFAILGTANVMEIYFWFKHIIKVLQVILFSIHKKLLDKKMNNI